MAIKNLKLNLKPQLGKLEVFTRKITLESLSGGYRGILRGKGMEFDGYKTYSSSVDDASTIDWKASLKCGELLVKDYMAEHAITVFFLVDVSNSMLFASVDKLKAEYAAELVASLAWPVVQAGNAIGIGMFTDKMVTLVPPFMGAKQFYAITKVLSDPNLYGGNIDYEKVFKFISGYLKKNTLIVLITDFIGLKGRWEKEFKMLAQKFDLIPIMVRDPRDQKIPDDIGLVVIEDPYSKQQIVIDSKHDAQEYERISGEQERKITGIIQRNALSLLSLTTDKPFLHQVLNYFLRRRNM